MSEQFSPHEVVSNNIRIHYYRSTPVGSGIPILFLHGVTDDGLCWSRVAGALSPDYDIILMDQRGHGLSDAPVRDYSAEDRAVDTAGLISSLELDHPILFGHSMGAETAVVTASLFPDHVRAAILEDPPWPSRFWGGTPEEREERAAQWRAEIIERKAMDRAALIEQARQNNPTWAEEELGPWADSKHRMSPNLVGMVTAPRRRWSDYLRNARCPILLLTGDPEKGAIISPKTAAEAASYWQNGQVAHIPGAGHSIHRDQFEPFMQAVRGFLDEVK
jgi:N-formylmaleamate deformylase